MNVSEFFNKFKSFYLWGNLLAMLLVVLVVLIGVMLWLKSYTHHGEGIVMPDFYGVDCRTAVQMAETQNLRMVINDSTYDKTLPAGCVVAQSPVKGLKVKEGRIVYVTVNSLSTPRVPIPDIVDNAGYREAQMLLQSMGFRLLPPKLIDGEKDWVYGIQWEGRNVVAGEMIPKESKLTLVVGNGSIEEFSNDDDFGDDDDESTDEVDSFLEIE